MHQRNIIIGVGTTVLIPLYMGWVTNGIQLVGWDIMETNAILSLSIRDN
jgi:hypothetical protein